VEQTLDGRRRSEENEIDSLRQRLLQAMPRVVGRHHAIGGHGVDVGALRAQAGGERVAGAVRDGEQNVLAGEIEAPKGLDEALGPVL
jgi:hypothetical protein